MDEPRQRLPVARLAPRDAGEHLVILRAKAKEGARRVGRFAAITTKTLAMLGLCGAGVYLVGQAHPTRTFTPSIHFDYDRHTELDRLNESLRMTKFRQDLLPKFELHNYEAAPKLDALRLKPMPPMLPVFEPKPTSSP